MRRSPVVRWCVISSVLAIYLLSFFLPVDYETQGGVAGAAVQPRSKTGAEEFASVIAWVFLAPVVGFPREAWQFYAAWCANPLLWCGLLLLARAYWWAATLSGVVAFLLGLAVAGDFPLSGYYVWLGSMALLALAGMLGRQLTKNGRFPSFAPTRLKGGLR